MQGFKKTLVALLAVTMVLSLVGTAFAAIPEDVAGTKYEDAAVRLMALGVFKGDDKGNFNPDAQITRAEAVAIIVRALGLEQSSELMKGVTKFADVNADPGLQWATGVINIAVSAGIVDGYPDGNFGGRDPVKYEELAKMIIYALNYGVTVEGGVWPTAVLAKADELEILDGISVVAGVPIIRGLAAKMLDNSLDVPSLEQTGYGDLKQYEKTGKTLLEKMGYEEVEGWVVGIPEVDNALDEDEVDIDGDVYTVLEGVDVAGLFGLKVKVWVNDDDEILFVQKKTADKDIFVDTLAGKVDAKHKVELVVLDDDVTFDEDATIYVNFKKADLEDLEEGFYGRLVRDKNKIVFASLFDFEEEKHGVVVTEVSGDKVKYFKTDDKERTLDLTDADAVTVYNKDLSKAAFDDIEKDTVLYWWEADDEFHLVIINEKAEGEVTKITNSKVTIDGKGYSFKEDEGTYSFDEDDTVDPYKEDAKSIKDFDEEEVVALLNLKGHIRHLRGDAETTSGTQYGIVVDAPKYSQVTIFTKDGEEVTYDIAKRADYSRFEDYKFFAAKLDGDDNDKSYYAAVAYKVNSDGEIILSDKEPPVGLEHAVGVKVSGAVGAPGTGQFEGKLSKEADSSRITLTGANGEKFYASSSTVIMRAVDKDGVLDPEVISWEDFEELKIEKNNGAIVFGTKDKSAKFIVFLDPDFEGVGEDYYYAVATSGEYRSGGKWKVDLDVFDEGKGTYLAGDEPFKEGSVYKFKLNAKGETKLYSESVVVDLGTGACVDDGYLEVGAAVYKIHSDAVIYLLKDNGKIKRAISAVDLEGKDKGTFVYVLDDEVVKAMTYKPVAVEDDEDDEDTMTFKAAYSLDDNVYVELDKKTYPYVGTQKLEELQAIVRDAKVTVTFTTIRGETVVTNIIE